MALSSSRLIAAVPISFALVLSLAAVPIGGLAQGIPGPTTPPGKQTPQTGKPQDQIPPEAAKAAGLFEKALTAQRANRIDDAIATYKQILVIAPKAYPVCINLGLIYQAKGDSKSAETYFLKAAQLEPKNSAPPTQLALLYLGQKRIKEAGDQAVKAINLDAKSAQARFALGGVYAATQKFALAEIEYKEAVKYAPQNVQGLFALSYVQNAQKKFGDAESTLIKALDIDPKNGQGWLFLGILRQSQKQFKTAIAAYRKVAALMPTNAAPWYNIGMCYQLESEKSRATPDVQEAISAYLKAIELSPKFVPARTAVARLYFDIGNYNQSSRYFLSALELTPKDLRLAANAAVAETYAAKNIRDEKEKKAVEDRAEARFKQALAADPQPSIFQGLAGLYEQQGQRDKAAEVYAQWVAKRPKDADALQKLAVTRETQGKADEAIDLFMRAAEAAPKDVQARFAIARLYGNMNPPKFDLAADQYKKAIAANPNSVEAHRLLGQLLLRQPNKTAEALAEFDTIKKIAPTDASPYVALASVYEREKKYDEALKEYRGLSALNPKDVSGHWYAARLLETLKRYDEAIAEYRATQKIAPKDTNNVSNIARLLELAGKKDEAIAEYKQLHEQDPKNVQFHAMYAQALEKQAKHSEAIREYEALIDGSPDASWAHIKIGDIYQEQKRWEDARIAYLRVVDRPVNATEAYNKLEMTFDAQHKPQEWFAFLKDRVQRNPDDRNGIARLEVAAAKQNRIDEMLAYLKDLSAKQQSNVVFLRAYAQTLQRQGKADDAFNTYRQVAKLAPDDYETRQFIGGEFEKRSRLPEAIETFSEIPKMVGVPPGIMLAVRLKLGDLYEKNGQKAEAIAQYREALKSEPNNSIASAGIKRLGG